MIQLRANNYTKDDAEMLAKVIRVGLENVTFREVSKQKKVFTDLLNLLYHLDTFVPQIEAKPK